MWVKAYIKYKTDDLKLEILKYSIVGLLGYFIGVFQSKPPPTQYPNNKKETISTKSKTWYITNQKKDTLKE